MTNAILIHGKPGKDEYYSQNYPSASNFHWFPWLQKQLLIHGVPTQTPEMFESWRPNYEVWRNEFERCEITPETMLVGHSCGGGFLVRWLSEHRDVKVGRVILVAPWLGYDPEPGTEETVRDFFNFTIDPDLTLRTASLVIFNSDNDAQDVHRSVDEIRAKVPGVAYREFHNYGHFCYGNLKTDAFPELLEGLIGDKNG